MGPTPRGSFILVLLTAISLRAGSAPVVQAPASGLPKPEHGLRFESPVQVWDEAIPIGNGIMGALLWGDGRPLKISLDRADLWDLRPVPEFTTDDYKFRIMRRWHLENRTEDLVRLYEDPYDRPAPTKIPAGRIELTLEGIGPFRDTSLSLARAVGNVRWDGGGEVEALVHATKPIGLIRTKSINAVVPRLIPPAFGGSEVGPPERGIGKGDLRQLGYTPPRIVSGANWQAFLQEGAEGFRFAGALKWKNEGDYWSAAWSLASSFESEDPLTLAQARAGNALDAGFDLLLKQHVEWWKGFWGKSSISVPNQTIERQWFLDVYKFGAASRRGSPPISLQAIWTADDGKLPPWKGDFHHDLNTQLSYWPCYSGNRLEEGLSYLDWLWDTRQAGFDWTNRFFELPGLNVPMTTDLRGRQIGGWRQYTHSATTAAWLAHHFYLHWKYSGDRDFLRDRAYPYIRDASIFLDAFTSSRTDRGVRSFPLSSSPEINDNRPDAWFPTVTNYDLALTRWLFGAAAELADELGQPTDASRWRRALSELPELGRSETGALLVAEGIPLKESHRHFSHLMAIYPLGLLDWYQGPESQKTIRASLEELERLGTDWWTGYSFAWLASLAARALDGPRAERALEVFSTAFTLKNSFHCNGDQSGKGFSKFTYRPFTLEGNFAAAAALQEMLLQSHGGTVRLFPAIPPGWKDAAFSGLRAEGAFVISAAQKDGIVRMVQIMAERGGVCRLVSPFSGKLLKLSLKEGESIILEGDPTGPGDAP